MPFAAKSAAPCAASLNLRHPVLDHAAKGGITLFAAPRGYLLTDSLAAALAEHKRPTLWLRLGPEDGDPATFLVSLIAAAQRLCPGVGQATQEHMRRQPGPIVGWPALFAHLGQELAAALPPSGALVLEDSHHLNDTHPTLALVGAHLLPALPRTVACILTADHRLPAGALPADTVHVGANELSLDPRAALELAERADTELSTACVRRMVALTEGRAVVHAGLCAASAMLGSALIEQAVERATSGDDLLARVARAGLMVADADAQRVLALTMRLEYSHPALLQAALGEGTLPAGPWLQPLADGWTRIRSVWHAPLRAALRAGAIPSWDALRCAADYLAHQGAVERAVPLYFELGEVEGAAHTIAGAADTLMNLGQWETLAGWLGQLPTSTLRTWPWLIHTGGELAAAQGDADAARRAFAVSAELFTARDDADGACQSMLAESALAAWHGDRTYAQNRALVASAMAEAAGLAWHQGWAAWQLGCLAAATGGLDDALIYFDRAATAASTLGDPLMVELLRQTEELLQRQRELRRQRELHRQAYFVAERAEQEAAERLCRLLGAAPEQLDGLLIAHGWSHTPLMLKLPAPAPLAEITVGAARAIAPAADPQRTGVWDRLLFAVGLRQRPAASPVASPLGQRIALLDRSVRTVDDIPPPLEGPLPAGLPATAMPLLNAPQVIADSALVELAAPEPSEPPEPEVEQPVPRPALTAYLLGPLRVTLNDHPIESWPGSRGRAIFKYLLTHRAQPIPRDVLMDLFWPEAGPEAARNSLNVAMYGLRQALKAAADVPVVLFQNAAYRLSPDLHVWLDVEEFEHHVQAGQRLGAAGQIAAAIAEYEMAVDLYQGDFFEEDLYEDWLIRRRESLKDSYLTILNQLSRYYLEEKNYTTCIHLCQKLLAKDDCREDTHRRLMRCYSRQGQRNLALRQYQLCTEALARALEVTPMAETVALYQQIRDKAPV
ncbi:MAG TPA: BTAD domain-containing putative transcriptional regulator [Roseiflexaceae bacterium]